MKPIKLLFVTIIAIAVSGCATITSEEMQAVTLTTKTKGGENVVDAKCSLKNDKGAWDASAPSHVKVHRSAEDLMVECQKEGHPSGFLRAISRAASGMWGNIIFGGGIGAIIDHNKGTGYDYPNELPVVMGETKVVDKKHELEKHQEEGDPDEENIQTSEKTANKLQAKIEE